MTRTTTAPDTVASAARTASPERSRSGFQVAGTAAERYEQAVAEFMLAWSDDLVETAAVGVGERVVDLACGTGFVSRIAATRVGAPGRVVGVDVNPHMVAEARRVTGLEIVEASAESTGLPDADWDVVLCQQGLQYFPEPDSVLREAHRLLQPRGRIAVSVWSDFDANPFRVGQLAAMSMHLTEAMADAYRSTSVASLGGLGGLGEHLRRGGFSDVTVEERERDVRLPPMRTYFPTLVAATPWKDAFEQLTEPQRDAVLDRLDAFVDHPADGKGSSVRMTVAVATGQKRPTASETER
jgi:ubiquinone/menaquinone biosynthesis C-methylase UbiE